MSTPRCRFAPSPTGYLHVGSAQSALFNWLFARGSGGEFVLRIEDTDAERNRPELTDNILDMLRWLGIDWDGEIVHQSDRLDRHLAAVEKLEAAGAVYWCDCTRDEIDARNKARKDGRTGYDRHCRDRGLEKAPGSALRFRVPDGKTSWPDKVRGEVTFENINVDDFVVSRSTGAPLFVLANTVDDAETGINHVIRGEDHVNNTAKYLLLWQALGFGEVPTFAHLPLLVNEQRKKLSKRRDPVSVADFKAEGYLPEAMRNYLALLGWGPKDDIEIRPIEEIVAMFRIEDVSSSPAFFDVKKLLHINGEYIRALTREDFIARASEFVPDTPEAKALLEDLAPLVQERIKRLDEVDSYLSFLWVDVPELDEAAWTKAIKDERAHKVLDHVQTLLADADWTPEGVEAAVRGAGEAAGFINPEGQVQLSKAQAPVRIAVTGQRIGLPLWEGITALGRERTLARLAAARERASA
ncbi:glutamate--tRNA ligase [Solirubrobacter phytolaccae]|uniref:Glutamate--tRNA ligase n=1 Tax=Solirubrobacter phytolaccae TaxID=1404360 RepID=A0A9X3N4B9_9ACTN|nr:glutamate--tRNA ligase [Solirubrobacter phytolaccae]MDA0179620.1 glutamate--tRNA ligase [Solirubrobacter phytolaccae]